MNDYQITTLVSGPAPYPLWDQEAYGDFHMSRSTPRHVKSEEHLRKIFAQAQGVPVLDAGLNWLYEQGGRIFVDYSGNDGYYTPGTGVIALAAETHVHPHVAIEPLGSLLGQALLDSRGLLPSPAQDREGYIISSCLTEVIARGLESTVRLQKGAITYRGEYVRLKDMDDQIADWISFKHSARHAEQAAREYDARETVAAPARDFSPVPAPAPRRPAGLTLERELGLLDQDFSGKPFFNEASVRALLQDIRAALPAAEKPAAQTPGGRAVQLFPVPVIG